ncbi:MAG: FAD:protein FMN transferase [Alphaproteobacteria bacterium]|nr:FAD:protein FMN transferase [Alphaproteobacteria bacterium]MDE2492731.1 FAD:protein FMN transferase [Alphaproteobacteria bacterium]
MATPCEVRLETEDAALAASVMRVAESEAQRIEQKFSRYRVDSVVGRINASAGRELAVDAETSHLLDFAAQCFRVSNGLFDVTSGVLRRLWRFDGSDRIPSEAQIKALRTLIGWQKVSWKPPAIVLPAGMEIDLGGLAKEYAVDKALGAIREITTLPALVNFGGDLRVSGPRKYGTRWKVAIESVEKNGEMAGMLELADGALATSGDTRRFLMKDGVRYGHILNPRTGWPVEHTPRSVTVAATTCVEAGMFATLAMLQGKRAEVFLKHEGVRAWCIR